MNPAERTDSAEPAPSIVANVNCSDDLDEVIVAALRKVTAQQGSAHIRDSIVDNALVRLCLLQTHKKGEASPRDYLLENLGGRSTLWEALLLCPLFSAADYRAAITFLVRIDPRLFFSLPVRRALAIRRIASGGVIVIVGLLAWYLASRMMPHGTHAMQNTNFFLALGFLGAGLILLVGSVGIWRLLNWRRYEWMDRAMPYFMLLTITSRSRSGMGAWAQFVGSSVFATIVTAALFATFSIIVPLSWWAIRAVFTESFINSLTTVSIMAMALVALLPVGVIGSIGAKLAFRLVDVAGQWFVPWAWSRMQERAALQNPQRS